MLNPLLLAAWIAGAASAQLVPTSVGDVSEAWVGVLAQDPAVHAHLGHEYGVHGVEGALEPRHNLTAPLALELQAVGQTPESYRSALARGQSGPLVAKAIEPARERVRAAIRAFVTQNVDAENAGAVQKAYVDELPELQEIGNSYLEAQDPALELLHARARQLIAWHEALRDAAAVDSLRRVPAVAPGGVAGRSDADEDRAQIARIDAARDSSLRDVDAAWRVLSDRDRIVRLSRAEPREAVQLAAVRALLAIARQSQAKEHQLQALGALQAAAEIARDAPFDNARRVFRDGLADVAEGFDALGRAQIEALLATATAGEAARRRAEMIKREPPDPGARMKGKIVQVNLKPKTEGEVGLPKQPIAAARLTTSGFEGDYNRYRQTKKAGTPDRAVLVMPIETLRALQAEGWPVRPGDVGENITSAGIAYADFSVGSRWRIGEAQIEITEPCLPCKTLGQLPYVGPGKTAEFIKTMLGRRGWYARVLEAGLVRGDDALEPIP